MSVINEYEELLIGNRYKISKSYFCFDKKGNEKVALSVIRYAIEDLLGWDSSTAIRLFNSNYIDFMKLRPMMKYIAFPSDVTEADTEYILYLLYPRSIDYDIKRYALRIYEKVIHNECRYPKDYMYGYLGILRAKICFQYALNKNFLFKSVDEMYSFFASKECMKFLKEAKLYQLYVNFYTSPLEYMHDSLPTAIKNDFLFHNYMFMLQYNVLEENNEKSTKK